MEDSSQIRMDCFDIDDKNTPCAFISARIDAVEGIQYHCSIKGYGIDEQSTCNVLDKRMERLEVQIAAQKDKEKESAQTESLDKDVVGHKKELIDRHKTGV